MSFGSAEVFLLEEADEELKALPVGERVAMRTAFKKLEQAGSALTFPHQSSVKGVNGLRELRPREAVADIEVSTSVQAQTNLWLGRSGQRPK